MSRRNRHEEDSSLELLLDTMCNTFGGVMFIAISIFVIISGMTQIEHQQETEPITAVDAEKLQHELIVLQDAMQELQKQMAIKQEELQKRQSIRIEDKVEEVAMLEKMLNDLTLQSKTVDTATATVKQSLTQTEKALQSLRQQIKTNSKQQMETEEKIFQQTQSLNKLKKQIVPQSSIVFKVLQASSNAPYFIILHGDQAYAVGPEVIGQAPTPAVTYENRYDGRIVICRPNPGKGIRVLSGKNLSSEFQLLINRIPPGRVPKFCISPGSAKTAFTMRELLKKRNVKHGIMTVADDNEPFKYAYSDKVKYEY